MTNQEKALKMHEEWNGKLETIAKSHVKTREDLAIAYTPGVAEPCKVIAEDKEAAYKYTIKSNTIAVVSDGSAVLGLGNIGPLAAMPVMEGKAVLFKEFGGVNAVPICLDTQDTEEIIKTVVNIAPAFGGINLEDISAPRCFEIEERLKELLDIPVFHDDQHGTAIVVLAGIINALKVTGKDKETCKVVVNGAGSAGVAITKLLLTYGFSHITMCDISGILGKDSQNLNWMQKKMVEVTNLEGKKGTLADALNGADIFVGVSAPNIVTKEMVASMNKDAILFAMANPVPEIMPDLAKEAGAKVVGTGRSDFPNQVNNVVAFPGIFKGALEGRATKITEEMKLATAKAIAKDLGILKTGEKAITGNELNKISDEELERNIASYSVFARVTPEHKVRIVKAWQKQGKVVAMTGDGVNDSPALKNADIGIAMGKGGTDVAKNASDMILADDNFVTIIEAVRQGRTIYDNIKKAIHFLIATNIGEITTIFIGLLSGMESPLLAIQLLWINLVTDSFPAIALGLEREEEEIMNRKPRNSKESIFAGGLWQKIITEGVMLGCLTLFAFSLGTRLFGLTVGRTMAFVSLGMLELVHSFNVKSEESIFKVGVFENKYLIGSLLLGTLLQVIVVVVPYFANIFELVPLTGIQWIYTGLISIVPIVVGEVQKKLKEIISGKKLYLNSKNSVNY